MTISSTSSRLEYTGNGVTTAFSVTFQFLLSSDLKVYQAGTLKTITTHYTVSGGSGSTGTVTFLTAPANAEEVVIVNDPPMTQTTDYVANDPFPAESHERALDKLTILIQRLKSQVDRALVLSDTTVASADFTLPSPVANKGLKWNSAADAIENTTFDIDAFAENAQTYATNAAASAAAALVSENNASTSETNAATSESNAAASETAAEAAAQSVAFNWLFDSGTSMADPGAGDFRLNNAAIASTTAIAVSANSAAAGSPDVSAYVNVWDNSTNATKGYLVIRKAGSPSVFALFSLSQVVNNTTWLQLNVTYITGSGGLSAADECYITPILTGDKGVDGIGAGDMLADGTVPMTGSLVMGAGTKIIFEGTTADDFETTLDPGEPTADRTITLPNASGTVALASDLASYLPLDGTGVMTGSLVFEGSTANDFETTLAVTDPTADRTITLPDSSGTVALTNDITIQTVWIPASAMTSRTTSGAASGSVEMSSNKNMVSTLDFDATTAEYAQFSINMPKSWDEGTVTAAFVWSHAATTTNFGVAWELAGVAVSDDDTLDVAFGTAQTVTDTGGTTNDAYLTSSTSAITIGGSPQANDLVMFQVNRAPANGSDTMAIDARLHGVRLMYSINTSTDA